jgi:hypothetical protein
MWCSRCVAEHILGRLEVRFWGALGLAAGRKCCRVHGGHRLLLNVHAWVVLCIACGRHAAERSDVFACRGARQPRCYREGAAWGKRQRQRV